MKSDQPIQTISFSKDEYEILANHITITESSADPGSTQNGWLRSRVKNYWPSFYTSYSGQFAPEELKYLLEKMPGYWIKFDNSVELALLIPKMLNFIGNSTEEKNGFYLSPSKLQQLRSNYFKQCFGDYPVIVKSIGAHEYFIERFIESATQIPGEERLWDDNLRPSLHKRWTATGSGVFYRRHMPKLFPEVTKAGYSKHQSACFITADVMHPLYVAHGKPCAGFVFPQGTYLLTDRLALEDIRTTNGFDGNDYRDACARFRQTFGFSSNAAQFSERLKQIAMNGISRLGHNDVCARFKITDDVCVGIFTDHPYSRWEALFYADLVYQRKKAIAEKLKRDHTTVTYPRIVYHLQHSFKVMTPYTEKEIKKDRHEAEKFLWDDHLFNKAIENFILLPLLISENSEKLKQRLQQSICYQNVKIPVFLHLLIQWGSSFMFECLANKAGLLQDTAWLEPYFSNKTILDLSQPLSSAFLDIINTGRADLADFLLGLHRRCEFLTESAKNSAMYSAATSKYNLTIVDWVLANPEFKHEIEEKRKDNEYTILESTIRHHKKNLFYKLLAVKGILLRPYTLILAAYSGRLEFVNALLFSGININGGCQKHKPGQPVDEIQIYPGDTPLVVAARQDHAEVVTVLIDSGALVNIKVLFDALKEKCIDTVKAILSNPKIKHFENFDLNSKDEEGMTLLNYAWEKLHDTSVVEALLAAGAQDIIRYGDHQRAIENVMRVINEENEKAENSCWKTHALKAKILLNLLNKNLSANQNIAEVLDNPQSELSLAVNKGHCLYFFATPIRFEEDIAESDEIDEFNHNINRRQPMNPI